MGNNVAHLRVVCKRCKHKWFPRHQVIVQCPKCKSARWNEPKPRKKVA